VDSSNGLIARDSGVSLGRKDFSSESSDLPSQSFLMAASSSSLNLSSLSPSVIAALSLSSLSWIWDTFGIFTIDPFFLSGIFTNIFTFGSD